MFLIQPLQGFRGRSVRYGTALVQAAVAGVMQSVLSITVQHKAHTPEGKMLVSVTVLLAAGKFERSHMLQRVYSLQRVM